MTLTELLTVESDYVEAHVKTVDKDVHYLQSQAGYPYNLNGTQTVYRDRLQAESECRARMRTIQATLLCGLLDMDDDKGVHSGVD